MTIVPMRPCRVGCTSGGRDWGYLSLLGIGALVTGVQHAGQRDWCCACMHGCGEKQRERVRGKHARRSPQSTRKIPNIVLKIRTSFSFIITLHIFKTEFL